MSRLLLLTSLPAVLHASLTVFIVGHQDIVTTSPVEIRVKFHNGGKDPITIPRSLAPYDGKMFTPLFKISCNGQPAMYQEGEGKIRSSTVTIGPGDDFTSDPVDLTKLFKFPDTSCSVKYTAAGVWKRAPFNLQSEEQMIIVDPEVVAAAARGARLAIAGDKPSDGDIRQGSYATDQFFENNCNPTQQAILKKQIGYARAMAEEAYDHLKCNGGGPGVGMPHVCLRFLKWFGVKSAFRKQEACQIFGWLRTAIKSGIMFDCQHPYCLNASEKYAVPSFIRRIDVDKINVCEMFWTDPGAETGAPVQPLDVGVNDTQAGDLLNAFLRFYTGIELRDLTFGAVNSAELAALYSLTMQNDAALLNTDNLQYYIENPGLLL